MNTLTGFVLAARKTLDPASKWRLRTGRDVEDVVFGPTVPEDSPMIDLTNPDIVNQFSKEEQDEIFEDLASDIPGLDRGLQDIVMPLMDVSV